MAKAVVVIVALFIASSFENNLLGQNEIWGMFSTEIFKTNGDGTGYSPQKTFPIENSGSAPFGDLIEATNGKFYGLTYVGGAKGWGVLFEYDPITEGYEIKFHFDKSTSGSLPTGSLIQANNGRLYGMTTGGGAAGMGVLFEFDLITNSYTKKIDFTGFIGEKPTGSLMQAANGYLYGVTSKGGSNDGGVLFEFNPLNGTYQKRADFSNSIGLSPRGELLQASNGKLYGLTFYGGANNDGTLFRYDPTNGNIEKRFDFLYASTGSGPLGSLIQLSNGKFYGLTHQGGSVGDGVLFEYDDISGVFFKAVDFERSTIGSAPSGSLTFFNNKVYGMTRSGGLNNAGVLFEYDPITKIYSKLFEFESFASGRLPEGSLTLGTNGKFYGMTTNGGRSGSFSDCGTLFEYDPSNNVFSKKIDFTIALQGGGASGHLIQGHDGKLYGMTRLGGNYGLGVVFQYHPVTGEYIKLYDFGGVDGSMPQGSLFQASNAKFYGMTNRGGVNDGGVLFEYDLVNKIYTKKIDFELSTGIQPYGHVIETPDGKIYGVTRLGGQGNGGVLFEFDPANDVYSKKIDFTTSIGSGPFGSPTLGLNGKIYGMTNQGGANHTGVLFEYDPSDETFDVKFNFSNSGGASSPYGSLIQATNGKLYGMTYNGGIMDQGTLFEYDPLNETLIVKVEFESATSGSKPMRDLTQAANGKLYGMTTTGGEGANLAGTLFEYDPATESFVKRLDLASSTYYTSLTSVVYKLYQTITFDELPSKTYGDADFSLSATSNSGLPIAYTSSNPSVATISGNIVTILKAGTTIISASQAGNSSYYAALTQQILVVNKAVPVISWSNPASIIYGEPLNTSQLNASANVPGTFTYNPPIDRVLNSGVNQILSVDFVPNDIINYDKVNDYQVLINVNKAALNVTADSKSKIYGDENPVLTKTYSGFVSNDDESSILTPPVISTTGAKASDAGVYPITLSGGGADNYDMILYPGTLTINKANQIITFPAIPNKTPDDAPFMLIASSEPPGRPITFVSSDDNIATINGNIVTIVGTGNTLITATLAGDVNFHPAADASQPMAVVNSPKEQTISFDAIADKTIQDDPFELHAVASSNLPVSFSSPSDNVSINGNQVTILKEGRVTITASQSGNAFFYNAIQVEQSFCIKPSKPSIIVSSIDVSPAQLISSATFGNQWYFNGLIVHGATNMNLTATASGSYQVQVKKDDCLSEFSEEILLTIPNAHALYSPSIHPNPVVNNTLTVFGLTGNMVVTQLIDLTGRIHWLALEKVGEFHRSNVSHLSSGVYVLEIQDGKIRRHIRFVKI